MKFRSLLSAFAFAAGLVFVTAFNPFASSPSQVTAKALKAALQKCDLEKFAELSSGKTAEEFRGMASELKRLRELAEKGDQNAKKMLDEIEAGLKSVQFEVKSEKIEGDYAVVYIVFTINGKQKAAKSYLHKVDGDWKIISDHEYILAHPDKTAPAKDKKENKDAKAAEKKTVETKPAETKPAK